MVFLRLLTLVGTRAIFTALIASSKFSSSSGIPSLLTKIPASHQDRNKIIKKNDKRNFLPLQASINSSLMDEFLCNIMDKEVTLCSLHNLLCTADIFMWIVQCRLFWLYSMTFLSAHCWAPKLSSCWHFLDERSLNNW